MPCDCSGYLRSPNISKFGVVSVDWSNAKQLWANAHPMNDDELLTKQALMVLEVDLASPTLRRTCLPALHCIADVLPQA